MYTLIAAGHRVVIRLFPAASGGDLGQVRVAVDQGGVVAAKGE
jgi:hypothetical protein